MESIGGNGVCRSRGIEFAALGAAEELADLALVLGRKVAQVVVGLARGEGPWEAEGGGRD